MERKPTGVETEEVGTLAAEEPMVVPSVEDYLIPEPPPQPSMEDPKVQQKLAELKERILEEGGMTIEPLEGDPFVLSRGRENEVVPNAVTTFHPDGSTSVQSLDEHMAQLAQERVAAAYFSPKRNAGTLSQATNKGSSITERAGRALKSLLKDFWSNLWK